MECPSFNEYIKRSIQDHWDLPALSDYESFTYQYKDVARVIEKIHIIFDAAGIKPGDKVALCGKNCSRWGVAFLATLTYGAVAVPILHEFLPQQVHDILQHSDSKILFTNEQIWKKLDVSDLTCLEGVCSLADYSLLHCRSEKVEHARENLNKLFGEKYPKYFRKENVDYYKDNGEELAIINYTSGTTSKSKGVMIPYRAMWSNYEFANEYMGKFLLTGDSIVSILPMAHMYGMAFEFIFEFIQGVHIYFMSKSPSPTVLLHAFQDIKPRLLVSVPLVLEKIVKKMVLPHLNDPRVRLMLRTPFVKDKVKAKICRQMQNAFGGNFYEAIIGGAAFNQEIETFLKDIKFNYTVGYGTTECAPILAYADWHEYKQGSCGRCVPRMEIKIDSKSPSTIPGEILARGMNVMLGYYKNEEATKQTLDEDGWYHTGDMGVMDADGFIFIRGRCKNMLLGSNGQNIYPEEIEDKLSNLPMVTECVVIQKGEKLYGLVYSDPDEAKRQGLTKKDLEAMMEQNRTELNKIIPPYCHVAGIRLMDEPFTKTPKQSIKRYLYMDYPV